MTNQHAANDSFLFHVKPVLNNCWWWIFLNFFCKCYQFSLAFNSYKEQHQIILLFIVSCVALKCQSVLYYCYYVLVSCLVMIHIQEDVLNFRQWVDLIGIRWYSVITHEFCKYNFLNLEWVITGTLYYSSISVQTWAMVCSWKVWNQASEVCYIWFPRRWVWI